MIDSAFLEARIAGCKKVDDCYVAWNELQDYLGTYEVTEETYSIIYEKIKTKYIEITGKDYTVYVDSSEGVM